MKIYLAARFSRQAEMRGYAEQLERAGHEVTSRWIDPQDEQAYEELTPAGCKKCAEHDVADVLRADAIIAFTEPPEPNTSRGGRHVEFGIAIAAGNVLMIVGPRENVFHWLPEVNQFDSFTACLVAIGR